MVSESGQRLFYGRERADDHADLRIRYPHLSGCSILRLLRTWVLQSTAEYKVMGMASF